MTKYEVSIQHFDILPSKEVKFNRAEFLDFLKWAGVKGTLATADSGAESFNLDGNAGDTFHLEVLP